MKKLFLAIALIAISIPTFSQVKVRPGLRLGLNASTITNHDDSGRLLGFSGAMFVNLHLSRFYELQPEMTYSNQGFKGGNYTYIDPYYGDVIHVNGDDVNIHYLGLSIANKFFVSPEIGLHFIIGPSLDINVSDNSNGDITPADVSFFGGIGYEFPMGLGIEARYKQGFVDVRDGYYDDYYYDNNYDNEYYNGNNKLNSVFQFSVYYKFGM
ncbi:porin family protein [Xanthomarina spongicola]|uniref:Outer membrane protein with beta-barrel domain n=1 Tax=Xanthomarina spongicola TaxID=570520 RepID=A0A316DU54_9FLAO|nr:porin family protein [Xanthomarina spongicola]PWK20719.1 outer membrane protein with beta-barrel domain [Xanthomarina spongicola]